MFGTNRNRRLFFLVFAVAVIWLTMLFISSQTNAPRTGIGLQKKYLEMIQGYKTDNIKTVTIVSFWENPNKIATLVNPRDKADIVKLMKVIKHDLWVDNKEVYPEGGHSSRMRDRIVFLLRNGERQDLDCWIGHYGGENSSLTLRSRTGEFRRTVQDIVKRKGKPVPENGVEK